jgi:ketosteroid isomerase-like protein
VKDEDGQNLQAMARYVASFEGAGMAARLEMFADDATIEDWYAPGRAIVGTAQLEQALKETGPTEGLQDYQFVLSETIVAGDMLVVLGDATAVFARDLTQQGRSTIRAHGKPVRWTCRDVFEFRGGKVVRALYGADTLSLARQLGIAPENGWLK